MPNYRRVVTAARTGIVQRVRGRVAAYESAGRKRGLAMGRAASRLKRVTASTRNVLAGAVFVVVAVVDLIRDSSGIGVVF